MKFNKLAKELEMSVSDLADLAANILPNANGGTDVDENQEKAIRALVTNSKTPSSSQGAHSTSAGGGANEVFETEAPSDTELGIAVLGGMLQEYENRLQGLAVAHGWIDGHEQIGDYPDDPIAAKLTKTVCLLRSLNIPYQAPHPAIKSSTLSSAEDSGLSLPPMVRNLLEAAYPDELTALNRNLPEQTKANRPQLLAGQ